MTLETEMSASDLRKALDQANLAGFRLNEENAKLRRALEPFAEMAKAMMAYRISVGNPRPFEVLADGRAAVDYEHLLAARVALKGKP